MNTLLLVDDDTALSELLVDYLSTEGFKVEAAFDGPSALARCVDTVYDLIILDVMLPGLTGLEVLQKLRKTSTTPVLMLTARGDDVDRIVGLEIGADDYLPNPAIRANWLPGSGRYYAAAMLRRMMCTPAR